MRLRRSVLLLAGAVVFVAAAAPASAQVTLNFNDLPSEPQRTSPPYSGYAPRPDTIVTDQYRNVGLVFGEPGLSSGVGVAEMLADSRHAVFALTASGLVPGTGSGAYNGDMYFRLVAPGTDTPALADGVTFVVGDAGGDTDDFQIRGYGLDGSVVDTQAFLSVAYRTVSIPVAVSRVVVDFTGDTGYIMDDLSFRIVPEPGAGLVLVSAAAFPLLRRRARGVRPRSYLK
jgi:hypothetical protein